MEISVTDHKKIHSVDNYIEKLYDRDLTKLRPKKRKTIRDRAH